MRALRRSGAVGIRSGEIRLQDAETWRPEGGGGMTADITFHYPPELFNLLVDAIPVLNKSKRDVLLFFQGAGVWRRT